MNPSHGRRPSKRSNGYVICQSILALCRLATEGEGYDNIVYDISAEQDSELARLKLTAEELVSIV